MKILAILACVSYCHCALWQVPLFIPETRRGRATLETDPANGQGKRGTIRVENNPDENTAMLKALIETVVNGEQPQEQPIIQVRQIPTSFESPQAEAEYNSKYGYERISQKPALPRKVDSLMSDFGTQMANFGRGGQPGDKPVFPQLFGFQRQSDGAGGDSDDEELRCVPKVMQVEETVYDRSIKCTHSYQEKCHMTYITDYSTVSEEKCETTFIKKCHITFKPMPFNDTFEHCRTPVERVCGDEPVGPDICSTVFETDCETRYKTYEVEQDEPICETELMKKCENVTLPFPQSLLTTRLKKRQTGEEPDPADPPSDLETVDPDDQPSEDEIQEGEEDSEGENTNGITIEQNCEEWPVQKCRLEKRTMTKVHPDTSCRKIPREVCIPNNCKMVPGEKVCREESIVKIQNVPQEDCELQPEENCYMEAVMVPKLVEQPNCINVPKETCINTKNNPRRVKKPVIKEWCYKPKDLLENPNAFPLELITPDQDEQQDQQDQELDQNNEDGF